MHMQIASYHMREFVSDCQCGQCDKLTGGGLDLTPLCRASASHKVYMFATQTSPLQRGEDRLRASDPLGSDMWAAGRWRAGRGEPGAHHSAGARHAISSWKLSILGERKRPRS